MRSRLQLSLLSLPLALVACSAAPEDADVDVETAPLRIESDPEAQDDVVKLPSDDANADIVEQEEGSNEVAYPNHIVPVEHGFLRTAHGLAEVGYRRIGDEVVIGGDMVIPKAMFDRNISKFKPSAETSEVEKAGPIEAAAAAIANSAWPNGIVYYRIDDNLPSKSRVTDSIQHWEAVTPFRFVAAGSSATAYVRFRKGDGCSATIGYTGGEQFVTLANSCTTGNVKHEIGHTIGLFHEQARADRDDYVTIHWNNIESGKEHNFERYVDRNIAGRDIGPYDFGSIMHYPKDAFGKEYWDYFPFPRKKRSTTISPKQSGVSIGQRSALSVGDVSAAFQLTLPLRVAVFRDKDFKGPWQRLSVGVHDAIDGELSTVGNDEISSVIVPPGLVAELCLHENAPPCRTFTGAVRDIGDFGWQGVSRVRVSAASNTALSASDELTIR